MQNGLFQNSVYYEIIPDSLIHSVLMLQLVKVEMFIFWVFCELNPGDQLILPTMLHKHKNYILIFASGM